MQGTLYTFIIVVADYKCFLIRSNCSRQLDAKYSIQTVLADEIERQFEQMIMLFVRTLYLPLLTKYIQFKK